MINVLISSVKCGHMGNLISNPTNTISLPTLWGHLGHFGLGSIFYNYYNLNCELVP